MSFFNSEVLTRLLGIETNPIIFIIYRLALAESGVWGVWVMVGVQGKVAFGLSHFCILSFSKKV